MRDEALRELEREWLATGDAELEQSYVQALIRRGLARPRLLLAAYLGSAGALGFLGDAGFPDEPDLLAFVRGLAQGRLARSKDLARESLVRALLAAWAYEVHHHESPSSELLASRTGGALWLQEAAHARREALTELSGRPGETLRRVALSPQLRVAGSAAAEGVRQSGARLRTALGRSARAPLRHAISSALLGWTLSSAASRGSDSE